MQQQLRDDIHHEKEKIREQYKEAEVLRKIVLGMQCEPLPDRMITDEIESMFNDMIRAMNITPEDYFKRTSTTKQQYSNEHWHQAANYVKSRLLLQYVADQEKIKCTDQDIQEAIDRLAKKQKVTVEELKNKVNARNLELQVRAVKAHQIILSTAKAVNKSDKSSDKLKHLKDLIPKENQDKASTVFGRDDDKKIIKLGKNE